MEAYWLYAAAAFALYGISNFYRKIAGTGVAAETAAFVESFSQAACAWLAVLAFGVPLQGELVAPIAAGALVFAGTVFSYTALQKGNVTTVSTVVINLNAMVAVPLGIIFLGEALALAQAAGIVLATVAVLLLWEPRESKSKGWLPYAAASMACFGCWNFLSKTATATASPIFVLAIIATVSAALSAAYAFGAKKQGLPQASGFKKLFVTGALVAVATIFLFTAFASGPMSLVLPVVNMNAIVTMAFAAAFLREKLSRKGLLAIAVSIASIWLIAGA